jgi:hypothetical protein
MVDQDPPHQPRRSADEVSAVLPAYAVLLKEPQAELVDQLCGLEGMIAPLAGHEVPSEAAELAFHKRKESIERGLVAVAPGQQKSGDLALRVHRSQFSP